MKTTSDRTKVKQPQAPEIIGWRERIGLPDFGISDMPAKIDTGARTSALHAVDQLVEEMPDGLWVDFVIPADGDRDARRVRAPVRDMRDIKNTSGVPERRIVIRTTLLLGRHRWHIDVSLANREKMEFDLILGRTAIRGRGVIVDPGHSFLMGTPLGQRQRNRRLHTKRGELT